MNLIKHLLPPFLYEWIYYSPLKKYGWFGTYPNWEAAERASKGYDSEIIIEKVKQASLKVKNGEFPYERDSKLFTKIHYDWPVLAGLLWIANLKRGKLNVIDFGGSLGSTYRQNRKFFADLEVKWNIVEQSKFVDCGIKYIQDERIMFYYDIPSCLKENHPNVILLSSVLSYVKDPYQLLTFISTFNFEFLIIDRIPLIHSPNDRLTVQKVPPYLYHASYPAWFFSKEKFYNFIQKKFDIIEDYDCELKFNVRSEIKGLILKAKKKTTRNSSQINTQAS